MTLKRALGTLLASRMAGRGGGRGGLGTAAMFGLLAGGRRGGLGGKAGLAGLAYMAYQAYQAQQSRNPGSADSATTAGGGTSTGAGGIQEMLGDLAARFGLGGSEQPGDSASQGRAAPEAEQAAEAFSDEKALLLIRAMIATARSDGTISADERALIMRQLDEGGADSEDRRIVQHEIDNPKSLDELLGQVRDKETAQEFYLASRAAVDRVTEAHRAYLANLRQKLGLSEADVAEVEDLAT